MKPLEFQSSGFFISTTDNPNEAVRETDNRTQPYIPTFLPVWSDNGNI
jgi:hypothetical protein